MPVPRLNVTKLREAAARAGDHTYYRIAQRTGLSESTVWRLVHAQSQPNVATQGRILAAYADLDFHVLMEIVDDEQIAA